MKSKITNEGLPFVLDALLEDDVVALSFDTLKRVYGASNLGDFHYVPMLFASPMKAGKARFRERTASHRIARTIERPGPALSGRPEAWLKFV